MTDTQLAAPETPSPEPGKKFQEMARASWVAPLIAIVVNFSFMLSEQMQSAATRRLNIVFGPLFIFGGLVLGIVALFGIAKYGQRKILVPALVGIGINVFLIVMAALPLVLAPQRVKLQPAIHSSTARLLKNEPLGFSMDIPEGFRDYPEGKKTPKIEHVFIKGKIGGSEPLMVITIERLNGTIPRGKPLRREEFPPNFTGEISSRNWRGVKVDTIIGLADQNGAQMVIYAMQIPLKPFAIQLSAGGPLAKRNEVEQLAERVLASLEGETNW